MPLDQFSWTPDGPRPWQAEPLTGDRYAECVEIYEAASDQRVLLQQALAAQIGKIYADRPLRMLSVGSGSGAFDASLLERLTPGLDAIGYTGIDPNPRQCKSARHRLASLAGPALRVDVINDVFTSSLLGGGYDVVQFVHCLYYFDDPGRAIDTAFDKLAPGGRLIIVQAPNEELNALAAQFWARTQGRDSWFSEDIAVALADRGLAPVVERINARLDAAGCPGSASDHAAVTVTGRAVADFIAQVDIGRLPAAIRARTTAYLGEIVQSRADGGRYFAHPVDVLTVVKD